MENKLYKIYRAIFPNGKCYIGQTRSSMYHRKHGHLHAAKVGHKLVFSNAIRKYGWENITWEILETVSTKEEALFLEKYYIKYFESHRDLNGYNSTFGGDGFLEKHSEVSKQKMREAALKNNLGEKAKKNLNKYYKENPKRRSEIQNEWLSDPKNLKFAQNRLAEIRAECKRNGISLGRPKVPVILVKDCAILEFDSISDAAKYTNSCSAGIYRALTGKSKTCKGYKVYKL